MRLFLFSPWWKPVGRLRDGGGRQRGGAGIGGGLSKSHFLEVMTSKRWSVYTREEEPRHETDFNLSSQVEPSRVECKQGSSAISLGTIGGCTGEAASCREGAGQEKSRTVSTVLIDIYVCVPMSQRSLPSVSYTGKW